MASVAEEEEGSTRIKSELHDHTGLPLRYASLDRVYSVSSSSSSSLCCANNTNEIKAEQLTVTDAPTHPRPEIVRVYSRRRRRLPDKEERIKRRRIGNSELMKLGVDSTTTLSVSNTLRGCRINNANKQNGSSKRKKLLQASPSAKKWVRLSYDGVDPTAFIGMQCKVFWPLDADWYTGSIIGYNVENKHHTIKYGDGDVEELALRREMIKYFISREEMERLNLKFGGNDVAVGGQDYDEMVVLAASFEGCQDFEPRDIIWAKLTGHAMWPAIVVDESVTVKRKSLNNKAPGGNSILVQFFGTHDFATVSEATSGAVGSLLSTTILYPLDTCKSKFQAEVRARGQQKYRHLSDVLWEAVSKRQILSLYQGLGTKNLQSFVSQFIYFYSYSYFKRVHSERTGSKSIGTKANLLIAAAAGACTSVLTQPLDTASSRMQTSEFGESKGLWKTLTGGDAWGDAFDGLWISLLLTSNPAIQYTVFDQLKQRLLKQKSAKAGNGSSSPVVLSAFMAFLLGAVSKSVATVITYPAIRCKVMIQAADDSKENETKKPIRRTRKTIPGVVYAIWRKEGMLGFFKGLHAQILKTVLSSALLLMIKEKISATTWILILAIRRTLFLTKGKLRSP